MIQPVLPVPPEAPTAASSLRAMPPGAPVDRAERVDPDGFEREFRQVGQKSSEQSPKPVQKQTGESNQGHHGGLQETSEETDEGDTATVEVSVPQIEASAERKFVKISLPPDKVDQAEEAPAHPTAVPTEDWQVVSTAAPPPLVSPAPPPAGVSEAVVPVTAPETVEVSHAESVDLTSQLVDPLPRPARPEMPQPTEFAKDLPVAAPMARRAVEVIGATEKTSRDAAQAWSVPVDTGGGEDLRSEMPPTPTTSVPTPPMAQIARPESGATVTVAAPQLPLRPLDRAQQGREEVDVDLEHVDSVAGSDVADAPIGPEVRASQTAQPMIVQSPMEAAFALRVRGTEGGLIPQVEFEDTEAQEQAAVRVSEHHSAHSVRQNLYSTMPRVEPSLVFSQIGTAVQRNGAGQIEVALNPPELGRLRISMDHRDTGIFVTISADRPETMDLIRRHVDQLEREFLEMGYQSATFNFGSNGGAPDQKDMAQQDAGSMGGIAQGDVAPLAEARPNSPRQGTQIGTAQLDIRI